jgi:hypothetical protein
MAGCRSSWWAGLVLGAAGDETTVSLHANLLHMQLVLPKYLIIPESVQPWLIA